ncbi:MAG: hypothetical protein ABGY42_11255 [bacterium]
MKTTKIEILTRKIRREMQSVLEALPTVLAHRLSAPARLLAVSAVLSLALAPTGSAWAAPGSLDTSYSGDGIAVAPAHRLKRQEGRGLTHMSEVGGLLVVGHNNEDERLGFATFENGSGVNAFTGDFGANGLGVLASHCPSHWSDAVMHQTSGFIGLPEYFVAGSNAGFGDMGCSGRPFFTVAHLTIDGKDDLVAEFTHRIEGEHAEAFGIARRSDGDLVAVGWRHTQDTFSGPIPAKVVLVRLNEDLTPESSFGGGNGIRTLSISSGNSAGYDVALQNDGKIVVVGATGLTTLADWPYTGTSAFVARFLPTGVLDSSFGTGGVITWTPNSAEEVVASGVAIAEDGDIVIAGKYRTPVQCSGSPLPFCVGGWSGYVRRLSPDGTLDSSFATGGETRTTGIFEDVAIDSVGNIIAVGSGGALALTDWHAKVVRYTESGLKDLTFGGGDGIATFEEPNGFNAIRPTSVVLENGGQKISVGGTLRKPDPAGNRMFSARLMGGGCFDGLIDPELGETDTDGDGIEDSCDNCIDECNPDQVDSDDNCPAMGDPGFGSCGDACDACPGFDQENQTPAEAQACNGAEYNVANLDCCFETDSDAMSTDPICTGGGDAILKVGGGSGGGPGDTPGGAGIKVPANCAGATFGITSETKSQKQFWAASGPGTWVGAYDFTPDGGNFALCNPKPVVFIEWVDADDATKKIGNGVKGVNANDVSPYQFGIFENSIAAHWADKNGNGQQITDKCGNLACGTIGADGFPTNWNGGTRSDDPTLKACCHKPTNRFFFEVEHFSAYGMIAVEEEEEECEGTNHSSQLKVVKLHKEGAQKVIFKSRLILEDADGFFMKPGAYFEIQDQNGDTLWEHDASDPALESWEFWKSNRSTTAKLIIKNADGGKLKVLVKRKRKGDPNEVEVKIIATRLDLPVGITDLPLTLKMDAKKRFGSDASDVHEYGCSKTDFSPEAGGICASNSSATMIMCRD